MKYEQLSQQTFINELRGDGAEVARMSDFAIEQFHLLYPWSSVFVHGKVRQVHEVQIFEEVLTRELHVHIIDGYFRSREVKERAYLLDAQGRLVEVRRPKQVFRKKYHWFGKVIEAPTEYEVRRGIAVSPDRHYKNTIEQYLKWLGKQAERVNYILTYHPFTQVIILYQPPRGETFLDFLERSRRERAEWKEPLAQVN